MLLCVRSLLLAFVTVAALVMGVVVPTQGVAAAPADEITPPIPSEPVSPEPSVEPVGEFTIEQPPPAPVVGRVAARRGPDVEAAVPVADLDESDAISKTEYTTTFRNDDGTRTTQVGLHRVERFVYLKWKGILVKKRAIYAKAWTDGSLTGVALFGFVGLLFVVGSMFNQP